MTQMILPAAAFGSMFWELLIQAQLELQIFLVACCTYALFRAKHRVAPTKRMLPNGFEKVVQHQTPEETKTKGAEITSYRNTVIKALRAGKPKEAQQAIEAILKAGHAPSASMFNELLDVTLKSGNDDVWGVIDLMKKCGMKPNRIACSILLKSMKASSKDSGVARILETLSEMDDDFDEVLVNSVVEACMRVGRADLLIPHLQHEKFAKVQLNNAWTYANIIGAYSSVGNIDGVWQTWHLMRKVLVPSKVAISFMVEALSKNGDIDGSYALVRQMLADDETKHSVTTVTYGSLLKGFSHQKKFDKVLSTYEEMKEHKLKLSLVTFNTLLDACARCGEMAHIPVLLKEMSEQGLEPNTITYSIVIKAFCQENRLEDALQTWRDMVASTSCRPDEAMYNTVLSGCARKGTYEWGMEIFAEMEQAGVRPSNVTLSVLVKLCKRRQLLDKAFELCKEVSQKYKFRLNVHVFNNLIQACLEKNDAQRALSVFGQMLSEHVRVDARTYTLLLPGCIQDRRAQDAANLLRLAHGIPCSNLAFCPDLDRASQSFGKVQGWLPSSQLADTLDGIGKCGEVTSALALIQELGAVNGVKIPASLKTRILSLQK